MAIVSLLLIGSVGALTVLDSTEDNAAAIDADLAALNTSTPTPAPAPAPVQPTTDPAPDPTPAATATSAPTVSDTTPPAPTEETSEPAAAVPQADSGPTVAGFPARYVLADSGPPTIRAFNDVEEGLADILVSSLSSTAWWELVNDLQVEEDLFISDVRVALDVLYHGDAAQAAVAVCDAVVASIPPSDRALAVHVRLQTPYGGGTEIDGSTAEWSFGDDTMARGDTIDGSGATCEAETISSLAQDDTEAYLAAQGN